MKKYDTETIHAILEILSKTLKDEKKDATFLSNKVDTFINGYNRAIMIAISTVTDLLGKNNDIQKQSEPTKTLQNNDGFGVWYLKALNEM